MRSWLTILAALLYLGSCVHYLPNEYVISTRLHGTPHACAVEATYARRATADGKPASQEVKTYSADSNGEVTIVFPHSGNWNLRFLDATGRAYPATDRIYAKAQGKTVAVVIELSGN